MERMPFLDEKEFQLYLAKCLMNKEYVNGVRIAKPFEPKPDLTVWLDDDFHQSIPYRFRSPRLKLSNPFFIETLKDIDEVGCGDYFRHINRSLNKYMFNGGRAHSIFLATPSSVFRKTLFPQNYQASIMAQSASWSSGIGLVYGSWYMKFELNEQDGFLLCNKPYQEWV